MPEENQEFNPHEPVFHPVFRAHKYELIDEEGRLRADWKVADGGGANMVCYDTNGGNRTDIGVGQDGVAYMCLSDAAGVQRLFLHTKSDGDSMIVGFNPNYKNNAFQLRIMDEGLHIGFCGSSPRIILTASPNGPGMIHLFDENGENEVVVSSAGLTPIAAAPAGGSVGSTGPTGGKNP